MTLHTLTLAELSAGLAAKRFSSREIVDALLGRIARANSIGIPYRIRPGQKLAIPAKATPKPTYEPFPGSGWFVTGRKSPIVAAMHDRLVAVGCNHYQSSRNKDVIGSGDVASYEAWQRKCGHSGAAATWPPGKSTWDKLHVPNV